MSDTQDLFSLSRSGRCRNASCGDGGSVYHAVPADPGRPGLPSVQGKALCGVRPGRRAHWSDAVPAPVSCPRCLKALAG